MSEVTRDSIFSKAAEPHFANVHVPAWGGSVRIYSMTVGERDAFDRKTLRLKRKNPDEVRLRERLLIACIRDVNGKPLFTDADELKLSQVPAAHLERPVTVALKINGFIRDETDEDDEGN